MMNKKTLIKALAVAGLTLGASSQVFAGLTEHVFFDDVNRLVGDPRRGTDEDYFNTVGGAAAEYKTPDNIINATAPVAGSVAGHIESTRSGVSGVTGINIPQASDVTGAGAADTRSAYLNDSPLAATAKAANGGTALPLWGVRAGAAVQWQTVQDGSTTSLTPTGSASTKAQNLTPNTLFSAVVGLNEVGALEAVTGIDDGLAPGSALDGNGDFAQWVEKIGSPTRLITGFGINMFDDLSLTAAAAAGTIKDADGSMVMPGAELDALIAAMAPRIQVYENGALFDQVLGSFDEDNFVHNNPAPETNGFAGDELNDAVDGTLALTGLLRNIRVETTWEATKGGIDAGGNFFSSGPILRTIKVTGEVIYDGGTLFTQLADENGTFSASWSNILFTNATGTDAFGAAPNPYDFFTDTPGATYSGDLIFTLKSEIPEPVTSSFGMLALAGLGAYISKRRQA